MDSKHIIKTVKEVHNISSVCSCSTDGPAENDKMTDLFSPLCFSQSISWKWLFGATAVAIGGVALSVVIAARN